MNITDEMFEDTIKKLSLKFTSGDTVPVERATITKDELNVLLQVIIDLDYEVGYDAACIEKHFPTLEN